MPVMESIGIAGAIAGGIGGIIGAFNQPEGPRTPELPVELEAGQLDTLKMNRDLLMKQIQQYDALIPQMQQRISTLSDMQRGVMPQADAIAKLNSIDQGIATQFGPGTLRDIQSNMISEATKTNAKQISDQIARYMTQEGRAPEQGMNEMIQEAVRRQFADGSAMNQAFDQVAQRASQLMNEVIQTQDPAVERQIKEGEIALRENLRRRFGSGYESTEAGRRALADYAQRSTETRFTTAEQLRTSATQRFGTLSQVAQGAALGKIQAQTGLAGLSQAGGAIQSGLYGRLGQLGELNIQQAQANAAADEAQRLNAQVALAASQQQRGAYQAGLSGLTGLTQLEGTLVPSLMQSQLGTGLGLQQIYQNLAQQKFTGSTKEAMEFGQVPGLTSRSDIYGGYYKSSEVERRNRAAAEQQRQKQIGERGLWYKPQY